MHSIRGNNKCTHFGYSDITRSHNCKNTVFKLLNKKGTCTSYKNVATTDFDYELTPDLLKYKNYNSHYILFTNNIL